MGLFHVRLGFVLVLIWEIRTVGSVFISLVLCGVKEHIDV